MDTTIIKSDLIQSPHAFSTRIGGVSEGIFASLNLSISGQDDDEKVKENWRLFLRKAGISGDRLVYGKQVHKADVRIAGAADMRPIRFGLTRPQFDGNVTNEPGVPLAVFCADCIPMLLEDTRAGVIGAIHCGWRPTAADIPKSAIEAMMKLGSKPEQIHAVLGPAIEICCFEVGPEVINAMTALIGPDSEKYYHAGKEGKFMLDLKGVLRERLLQLGLEEKNIGMAGECTCCHPEKYYSYRYCGEIRGSLAGMICLPEA